MIDADVKRLLNKQHILYTRYFTTPAPLQNLLWYVVAGTDSGYYTGFRSVFDRNDTIALQYFPRNDSLLHPVMKREDVRHLIRFSRQFYTAEQKGDTLIFNDLRFGQIMDWDNPKGKFVFHYFLEPTADNMLVVQRGRFEGWNRQTIVSFWRRIKGSK